MNDVKTPVVTLGERIFFLELSLVESLVLRQKGIRVKDAVRAIADAADNAPHHVLLASLRGDCDVLQSLLTGGRNGYSDTLSHMLDMVADFVALRYDEPLFATRTHAQSAA